MNNSPEERRRKYSNIKITNNNLVKYSAEGNLDVVKYLVEKGVNIHADVDYALRWSASNGHLNVVKYLLENGANIHAENDTALRYSAGKGHLDIVKYLVEKGANIHAYDDYALRWSAQNGHLDVVKYLVEKGANIHAQNDLVLKWSALRGHLDIVKYLVENGANIDVIDIDNIKYEDIRKYLIRMKKQKSILKKVRRIGKQNLLKKDNYITEWQSYCKVINDNSNIEELRKISTSVGLPIMKDNRYLSKVVLCSQLGIQLEQYLSIPNLTYEHDCYEMAELGTDFSTIPEECIFRDKNNRCFAINDILDDNGYFRDNMETNPYTRKEWELDIDQLRDIQKSCNKYSKLDIIHKIENYNKEDLQLGIVRSILNELDNKIYSNNIITLLEVNLNTLNRLLNFLYNEGEVDYNSNELSNIRNSDFEIDFLAKLLSITRGKINDDIRLANLILMFLNPE